MSALAQTTVPTSSPFEWQANIDLILGLKGATTTAICFAIAKFINNVVLAGWFDQWIGKKKLLVASGVQTVIAILGYVVEGGHSIPEIIALTFSLVCAQVFIDQAKKQFFTPKGSV